MQWCKFFIGWANVDHSQLALDQPIKNKRNQDYQSWDKTPCKTQSVSSPLRYVRTYQFSFDERKEKLPLVLTKKKIHTGESRMPYTVVVEGNVGAGKSTFVEILAREDARISPVPEPVSAWQNVSGTGVNLLGMSSQHWTTNFESTNPDLFSRKWVFFSIFCQFFIL